MINLTEKIIILTPGSLHTSISSAISATRAHLSKRYQDAPSRSHQWTSQHAFNRLFSDAHIKHNAVFDEAFIQSALTFLSDDAQNRSARSFFQTLATYLHDPRPPAAAIHPIKQGIKILLVELWNQGAILLPTVFTPGSHFQPIPLESALLDFIAQYDPEKSDKPAPPRGRASDARRMFYYMPRVIMATSWRKVEDVELLEFSELHRAQRLFMSGKSDTLFMTSPVPWSLFLNELLIAHPDTARLTHDDLKRYTTWIHGSTFPEKPFSDEENSTEKNKTRKIRKKPITKSPRIPKVHKLGELGQMASHESALDYFKKYTQRLRGGIDWLDCAPNYPGREHVSTEDFVQTWRVAFRSYLHHRESIKGYESDREVVGAINLLADYLFLYLPWWKELFPESQVDVPRAPKDFSRYAFVFRSTEDDLSKLPITFPEIIKLRRRSRDSQYAALKQIGLFFKFVEANLSEDVDIAGPEFRSPIFDEFDMPKVKKRAKTSKVVFPKNSYGYLIHYGYAVEGFGEYLLERCLAGGFTQEQLRTLSTSRLIDTSAYGFVPYVAYRGKLTPLDTIPNVFTWAVRRTKDTAASDTGVFIPHLTTLRVLASAVEIGLRLSAIRWLDRRTWDKNNLGCSHDNGFSFRPNGKYVYDLHVNSDKTKAEPWDTHVVFRVRAMLLREQEFQLSINEDGMDDEVPYKNRPQSRFGCIQPLFRSVTSAKPIAEDNYQDNWVLYMTGFQDFMTNVTGTFVPFVKIQPTGGTIVNPKVVRNENGIQYCPVSILSISTPHACRASFATNRQGMLETSEIAELIGHENPEVTEYYQSPRAEDLREKLELSDKAIHGDHRKFDKNSAAYVHPDKNDSALVRSFKTDREMTMSTFGFMPPMSLWKLAETEDIDEGAIEALRNGPMSLIRFRETHICPVGEECPLEIVHAIGGFRRCGLCPLALKCVDHLPAISAKKHAHVERIKYLSRQKDEHETAGETSLVETIWEELDAETNELLGWQLSEEVLSKIYLEQQKGGSTEIVFHAERPDIVRRHLQRIVKQTGPTEFLLQRIAESNAYPSLQSPQVQAIAVSIRRRLLAGREVPDLLTDIPGPGDVGIAANLLKTVMAANNVSVEEMSLRLENRSISLPSTAPLRIVGESV